MTSYYIYIYVYTNMIYIIYMYIYLFINTLKLTKTYNIQSHKKSIAHLAPYPIPDGGGTRRRSPIFRSRSEVEISCPKDTLSGIYNCLNLRRGWGRIFLLGETPFFWRNPGFSCEVKGFGGEVFGMHFGIPCVGSNMLLKF